MATPSKWTRKENKVSRDEFMSRLEQVMLQDACAVSGMSRPQGPGVEDWEYSTGRELPYQCSRCRVVFRACAPTGSPDCPNCYAEGSGECLPDNRERAAESTGYYNTWRWQKRNRVKSEG